MTHQIDSISNMEYPKETIISWKGVATAQEINELIILGAYKNLEFCQIIHNGKDMLSFFPNAIHYLDYYWLLIPELYDLQGIFWKELYEYLSPNYEKRTNPAANLSCLCLFRGIIESLSGVAKDCTLLDFGCGTGISKDVFSQNHIVGYDINAEMLQKARSRNIVVLDAESFFAQPVNVFDGCIACYVFHMGIRYDVLQNLSRTIKPTGFIVANYYKHLGEEQVSNYLRTVGFSNQTAVIKEGRFGSIYVYRKVR